MNRSKIEWCDHTWNPVTGCKHGCAYCYANIMTKRFSGNIRRNKMAKGDYTVTLSEDGSTELYVLDEYMLNETGKYLMYPFGFEPTFHRYRFDYLDKLKSGHNIFVCAMADLFGDWVPDEWIGEVIQACVDRPRHNYMFLTKNPQRYMHYELPARSNMWYGTTITREEDLQRMDYLPIGCKTFLSIEPLFEAIEPEILHGSARDIDWMIIGAETGQNKNKVVPQFEWIKSLVLIADRAGVPVFMKDSLIPIVGEKNMRREFPQELLRKEVSDKRRERYYEGCAECGKEQKKGEMVALLARGKRGTHPKQYAYLCRDCFEKSCKNMGVEAPNFDDMED